METRDLDIETLREAAAWAKEASQEELGKVIFENLGISKADLENFVDEQAVVLSGQQETFKVGWVIAIMVAALADRSDR